MFTFLVNRVTMKKKILWDVHGNFSNELIIPFSHHYFRFYSSFDVKQKLWHTIESLPRKIACYSAVESNGMIFAVCGKESSSAQHAWGFWCYDPSKNIWTRKAHIEKSIQTPRLFKAKRNICFFNDYADFQVYDSVLDRWNMVIIIINSETDFQNNDIRILC